MREEDKWFSIDLIQEKETAGQHLGYSLLDSLHRHLKELHSSCRQLFQRKGAMPLGGCPKQDVVDSGPRTILRITGDADALRNLISSGKTDAANLFG